MNPGKDLPSLSETVLEFSQGIQVGSGNENSNGKLKGESRSPSKTLLNGELSQLEKEYHLFV